MDNAQHTKWMAIKAGVVPTVLKAPTQGPWYLLNQTGPSLLSWDTCGDVVRGLALGWFKDDTLESHIKFSTSPFLLPASPDLEEIGLTLMIVNQHELTSSGRYTCRSVILIENMHVYGSVKIKSVALQHCCQ